MRDLYRNVLVSQHFNPANSTVTRTSTTIDLQGFNSAAVAFAIGQSGDTLSGSVFWTLKLTHSDDDTTYVDVPLSDLLNTTQTVVIDASTKDRTVYSFGYNGNRRYLRAVATPTGTHSVGTPIGIVALRGTPSYAPVV
ncbi:MAG: hypothetical protein SFW63_08200 [Alphaproteobacteria bacterium]|nr:hypothetical protein [Alphaproteobacteria bacterium]